MADMPIEYYLDELRANIAANDSIKARVLLSHLPPLTPPLQQRLLFELSRCTPEFAVPVLGALLIQGTGASLSLDAIRIILADKLQTDLHALTSLLDSPTPQDKRLAIELAGALHLREALPALLALLQRETGQDLLHLLLAALGNIGAAEAVEAIAEYLYATTKDLVTAAVQALAHMASPEAVQHLAARLGNDSQLDRLILDTLAGMPHALAMDQLAATLGAEQAPLRNAAKQHLHRLGTRAMPALLKNLQQDDTDVLIHTLNLLGSIGDAQGITPIRQLLRSAPADANVRFAAYEALGMLPLHKGTFMLADGLADPVEHVRIAAARAVERHHQPTTITGILNILSAGDTLARHTAQALIDAEAEWLFLSLINNDVFQPMALDYLATGAHPDTRQRFVTLLRRHGLSSLADGLQETTSAPVSDRLVIYAVDDSRMILHVYKTALYQLGHEAHLFEFPASAIEQAKQNKPDVVFTDLNMPDITGIELATSLRAIYSPEDLPIILVTTQSEGADTAAAYAAGMTTVLHKPFTAADLEAAITTYLPRV